MSHDANISAGDNKKGSVPEAQLLAYLEGRLSPAEQHEVELWLAAEGMESDAMDGLMALPPQETRNAVNRLNHKLHKEIGNTKKRSRRPVETNSITLTAIAVVLLLAVIAYVIVCKVLPQAR